jgi:WD40 repeat protein
MGFSPNSRWFTAIQKEAETVSLWDLASPDVGAGEPVTESGTPILGIAAFSPNSRWLLNLRDGEDRMRLFDLESENFRQSDGVELRAHRGPNDPRQISSAEFGPNGHWLATFSDGSQTRLWDLSAKNPAAAPIVLTGLLRKHSAGVDSRHNYGVRGSPFSGDGRWFVTRYSTWDGIPNTALWELRLAELVELAQRTVGRSLTQEERQLYLIPDD